MKMSNQNIGIFASLLLHGSLVVVLMAMGKQLTLPGCNTLMIDFSVVSAIRQPALAQQAILPVREVKPPAVLPAIKKKLVKTVVEPLPTTAVVPLTESFVAMEEVEEDAAEIDEELAEATVAVRELEQQPMVVMAASEPRVDIVRPVALPVAAGPQTVDVDAAAAVVKPLSPAELYLESHFLYIKDGVQKQISYPLIARRMGWEGRVVVCFVVCADGNVTDIRVVESSGFAVLDKNAVATIRQAAPFPKPPVRARLTIPISFRLG